MSGGKRWFTDDYALYEADCRDVLPWWPADSIDAVVCDPPYDLTDGKGSGGGFMGHAWDATGVPFDPDTWRAVYRVMKPGAHLLAFGATRTYHRLACAIEDAGFEIRDSLHWVYGSGFPKSLDVGKAIDKANGNPLAFREFARAYAAAVEGSALTHADIDRHLGIKSSSCYWAREDYRGGMPPRQHWDRVRALLGLDAGFERLYDAAEREVTGIKTRAGKPPQYMWGEQDGQQWDVTAPATEAAARWDGWGTALKPAHEPIVLARKPFRGTVAASVLANGTGALNVDGCRVQHASAADLAESQGENPGRLDLVTPDVYGAGRPQQSVNSDGRWPPNLLLTHHPDCEPAGTVRVNGTKPPGGRGGQRSMAFGMSAQSKDEMPFYTDADGMETVESTAGCVSRADGDECDRLLSSILDCLENCPSCLRFCDGQVHRVLEAVRELPQLQRGASVSGCSALARTLERILQNLQTHRPTEGDSGLPAIHAGMLASRTPHGHHRGDMRGMASGSSCTDSRERQQTGQPDSNQECSTAFSSCSREMADHSACRAEALGRILDLASVTIIRESCPVREMDAQSGSTKSKSGGWTDKRSAGIMGRTVEGRRDRTGHDDAGGASRFFPAFRYQAKAPKSERPSITLPDGRVIRHSTVKPMELMRWLVRLVCPPGGTVLDPFAGTGPTLLAAQLEGMRSVGTDSWDEACMLACQRLGLDYAAGDREPAA